MAAWLFEEVAHLHAGVEDRRTLPVPVKLSPPYQFPQGGEVPCRMVDRALERCEPGRPLWSRRGERGRFRRRIWPDGGPVRSAGPPAESAAAHSSPTSGNTSARRSETPARTSPAARPRNGVLIGVRDKAGTGTAVA